MRSLAIKSLPSYEEEISDDVGIGKESIDISRPQSRSTVKNLEDVTLIGFGTNLTLDELVNNFEQDETFNTNFLGVPHLELNPEEQARPTSWAHESGGLTIHKTSISGDDDPILQSILERQKNKVLLQDAMDRFRRPLIEDGSDASETTRIDSPGPGQGPSTSDPDATDTLPNISQSNTHWAEHVFADLPSSHTELNETQRSEVWGPLIPENSVEQKLPDAAKILLRLSFDDGLLRLMIIIDAANGGPCVIFRVDSGGTLLFSWRAIHEIFVQQVGNGIELKRWSPSVSIPESWAVLNFATWEGKEVTFCLTGPLYLETKAGQAEY